MTAMAPSTRVMMTTSNQLVTMKSRVLVDRLLALVLVVVVVVVVIAVVQMPRLTSALREFCTNNENMSELRMLNELNAECGCKWRSNEKVLADDDITFSDLTGAAPGNSVADGDRRRTATILLHHVMRSRNCVAMENSPRSRQARTTHRSTGSVMLTPLLVA